MHPPKVYANISMSVQQDWLPHSVVRIAMLSGFTTNLGENRLWFGMSIRAYTITGVKELCI